MKIKKTIVTKDLILLVIYICIYAFLQYILQISKYVGNLSIYNGVFGAFQYGVCLLMLHTNHRYKTHIALVAMSISALYTIISISKGAKGAVPGLFNALFYIITIILLAAYSARRERESKTDQITGAYNRKGLYAELQSRIDRAIGFSIIYINLNNFKFINDSYGHAYGDELLRKTVKRIKMRYGDNCTVARIGGAELVVVIDNKISIIQEIADRLVETLREKAILIVDDNKVECYTDGFAGVSSFPDNATDYESLIKYADIAVTEAMARKSKQAYLFNEKMLDRVNRQVYLQNLIKECLIKNYFYLVYQPQFDIKEKKLRGFEALIRMVPVNGESVGPGEFIPIAEKSDLIMQIDNYVLALAMKEFRDIVIKNPELTISVNVSAQNFADMEFVERIKQLLSIADFPAQNIEIEITEYCMVHSLITTRDNINALRDLGVKIALDDFGTGYTALNYVASLPFDLLKIDKSLIDNIENTPKRRDFVRTVITMGQLMECEIISEGVENDSQIACLKEDGCDFVQGFVWSKPLMYKDAIKLTLPNE